MADDIDPALRATTNTMHAVYVAMIESGFTEETAAGIIADGLARVIERAGKAHAK